MKNKILSISIAAATIFSASLFVVTTAQAGDSVNVSMPTNNPPVSEYKITLANQSGKDWTYTVAWVRGKALSHWDLSLGSCLGNVTGISGGGAKEPSGDPSNATGASGHDSTVKGSPLIKWDTAGGTFTITMDKVYQKTDRSVLAKTATVYNTGMVSGPDCTKEVVATPPVTTEPTPPVTIEPTPPVTTEPTPPVTTEPTPPATTEPTPPATTEPTPPVTTEPTPPVTTEPTPPVTTEPTPPVTTEPATPVTTTNGSSDNCASKSKVAKSTSVSWADSKGTNAYTIESVSVSGRTWTYRVTQTSGKALSHWTLGIPACMSKIVNSTSTDGSTAEIGNDASIKDISFSGIKWNSEGGVYSFTLDNDYAATTVDVLAKAGSLKDGGYSTSTIMGPDCSALATVCSDKPLSGEQDVVAVHVWKRITSTPISPEAYQALDKKAVESGVYAIEEIDASGKTVDIKVEVVK